MSNSWHELMQTLRFNGRRNASQNPTEEVISAFEQEHKVIFPSDYKEFCKLFGTGEAGDWLRIYCPGDPRLLDNQEIFQSTIRHINFASSGNNEVDDRKIDLLSNGFCMADDRGAHFLMWDLRTYREEDLSYDLYWVLWDGPESENFEDDIKFVGRSFFKFIQDLYDGLGIREVCSSESITRTYYRF